LQDLTDDEIAKRLDLEPRAVRRKIKIIGEKWTEKSD
jgi:transcription initiation factor IIE alpha subunit